MPLLSLTTHLALLSTRLPALTSQKDEDPFFDDDWAAATPLYPSKELTRPPVTLLIAAVGGNLLFDPSKEEIAVADTLLAVSLAQSSSTSDGSGNGELRLLSIRTVDPPSSATTAGVPDAARAVVVVVMCMEVTVFARATDVLCRNSVSVRMAKVNRIL